VVASSSF
jgi:hypothetical protein